MSDSRDSQPEEAVEPSSSPAPERPVARSWQLLTPLAAVVGLVSLALPVGRAGLWDPHELDVADLSRRIALNLLGGSDLAVEGAENAVPTLGELARGQLPFTSIALGFRAFGLTEWAGRLPLVLWGLIGLLAIYALLRRLADSRTAAVGVVVLATMPLYFLQARTLLGDIVTMASLAVAVAGLGIAALDERADGVDSPLVRGAALVFGLLGLVTGFAARGALIGVAIPALGVGLTWLLLAASRGSRSGWIARVAGLGSIGVGGAAAYLGLSALAHADPAHFDRVLGAVVDKQRQLPTFDVVVKGLGHGLLPWSAVVPAAAARLLTAPVRDSPEAARREAGLRVSLLLVATFGLGVFGLLAPVTGTMAYGPVFALAGIVAIGFRDLELRADSGLLFVASTVALLVILVVDVRHFPVAALSGYSVTDAKFPDSFVDSGTRMVSYGMALTVIVGGVCLLEPDRPAAPFSLRALRELYRRLWHAWAGNLRFLWLVVVSAGAGFAILIFLSDKFFHIGYFERLPSTPRAAGRGALLVGSVVLAVIPALVLVVREVTRWLFARIPVTRPLAFLGTFSAFALTLSLSYYPALASQISPKEVFESYRELAGDSDRLAMLGESQARSAAYYTGGNVTTFTTVAPAFDWLSKGQERRFLVIRSNDLPQLNSKWRSRHKVNVPVLDARSSEILLVSSRLVQSEANQNPFAPWVLDVPAKPAMPVDFDFGGQLRNIGWEVTDEQGSPVAALRTRTPYLFKIHYQVTKPISGNWKTFIHIDGYGRRHNGDHDTLEGKYPLHLWRVGDHIVDVHAFQLAPNFSAGKYEVLYGLFIGNRRLEVKRGKHHENRVRAGFVTVE